MIKFEIKVKMPFLWGKAVFKKEHWNQINLIVGPNGSGKTLLAEEIAHQFEEKGYTVEFLQSDRSNQEELLSKIKEDSDLREKIEIDAKNPKYLKVVWGIGYKMEKYN